MLLLLLAGLQVALKLLKCWQGIVVNSQDLVKPYIHGLLPPVVSVQGRGGTCVCCRACCEGAEHACALGCCLHARRLSAWATTSRTCVRQPATCCWTCSR